MAEEQSPSPLELIHRALGENRPKLARRIVRRMHPAEVADLLESLPLDERAMVWELVDAEKDAEVLLNVHDEVRQWLIRQMDLAEVLTVVQGIDLGEVAELLPEMPDEVATQVLRSLDMEDRERLTEILSYPEDGAGGMMRHDHIPVRPEVSLGAVLRYLRRRGEMPPQTNLLVVIDRGYRYLGVLRLRHLLTNQPKRLVGEVMERDFKPIPVDMEDEDVVKIFEQRDMVSAPVVNADGIVLGRITVDEVVDVIREEAEHSIMSMAGLDEEADMFAPVLVSSRRRALWLGINLLTALLAAWVIGLFEATLQQVVALAVLMPVVASMGGIAGSQTLTLMIRGLALGYVAPGNRGILFGKEIAVGAVNGLLWALVVALLVVAWFGDPWLGCVIALAVLANLLAAALAGVAIPLVLDRFGVDPALAGGVVLTTVTDVVGFFTFLGLGSLLLL